MAMMPGSAANSQQIHEPMLLKTGCRDVSPQATFTVSITLQHEVVLPVCGLVLQPGAQGRE